MTREASDEVEVFGYMYMAYNIGSYSLTNADEQPVQLCNDSEKSGGG